jgi:hypothetical protein
MWIHRKQGDAAMRQRIILIRSSSYSALFYSRSKSANL